MPRTMRLATVLAALLLCSDAGAAPKGIWMCQDELAALPMSGAAWDTLVNASAIHWGTPNLSDQTSRNSAYCVAGGLVFARKALGGTVDTVLR